MTRHKTECLVLPAAAAEGLAADPVGKLRPIPAPAAEPAAFTLMDSFDGTVARRPAMLLELGDRLDYWGADGAALSQTAARQGDFVADLADGPVKEALRGVPALRSLMPVGSGTLETTRVAYVDDEAKTQARARLHLLTGEGGGRVAVATVEGLRGYDKAFAQVADALRARGGAPMGARAVIPLLFPDHAPYDAKPDIPIGPEDAAFDVASDIIAAHLGVARRNEAGMVADLDTEFLHDYRVALRKIRSVLSLFRGVYSEAQTQALKARFSALMAPTGRLRDLDVYLLEREGVYALLPESLHGGLDRMFAMFAEERAAEHARLVRHLRSAAYETEIAKLEKLFARRRKLARGPAADRPAHAFASRLIWKRYRRICRIAAAIDADTPDAEVHELRIHCKKLRYLMEFFAPAFPRQACKRLIKALKRLQTTLGDFNDHAVQQESLTAFLAGLDPKDHDRNLDLAQSVGALIAVLHQRQLEARARVVSSFAEFNSPETQASFRELFHAGKESA